MQLAQTSHPNALQLQLHKVFRRRAVAMVLRHVMHRLDTPLMKKTAGKWSLPPVVGGLSNTILLITTGARTGKPRFSPLLAHQADDGGIVIIGTNFGRSRHPGWYYNIRAYPVVDVTFGGETRRCVARDANADERTRYWAKASSEYSGYTWYARHTGSRRIPIIVLNPQDER
jgi:F420H(2)-dependent quinone reductase